MKYILYPGYALTVSAASMVEVTALSDVQVIGATAPTTPATPVAPAAEMHGEVPSSTSPVTVSVTKLPA